MRGLPARAHLIAGVVAVVALAASFALPSAVVAKTTFSYKAPVSGSSSAFAKPKLSVYIVDTYGIKGTTSFSVKVDGKTVKPRITYKKRGDYRHVTLSFQVTTGRAPNATWRPTSSRGCTLERTVAPRGSASRRAAWRAARRP
jgi:hypothetical protein